MHPPTKAEPSLSRPSPRPSHPLPRKPPPSASSTSSKRTRSPSLSGLDREGLRNEYGSVYNAYVKSLHEVMTQKRKITDALRNGGGSGNSDCEMDLMMPEEIEELTNEHKRLHNELETIKALYTPVHS